MSISRPLVRLVAAVAAASLSSAAARPLVAQASQLTFEDLCYSGPSCSTQASSILFSGGPILSSYAGFSWTNFRALDLVNYPLSRPENDVSASGRGGYPLDPAAYGTVLGLSFGDMAVRRPTSGSGFGVFQFNDLSIGSGWTQGMQLSVTGRLGGASVFALPTITLYATQSSFLDLPDLWIDELVFSPVFMPAGYSDPYLSAEQQTGLSIADGGTPYQSFWFDNVTTHVPEPSVTATPEPATLALLAVPLLGIAAGTVRRRRRLV